VNFVYSQVIRIEVSEVMETYGYDTNVFNVLEDKTLIFDTRKVNGVYDIDLTNKTFIHIKNNMVESEGKINFEFKDNIILVKFLIGGYDNCLLINTDIYNEQVIWFSVFEDFIEISKFSEFKIIKDS
jgi:hypothetical protein